MPETKESENSAREYESLFICSADLPEGQMEQLLGRFQKAVTEAGGTLGTVEKWGRRKLSFPIRRQREGFYLYWTFSAPPAVAKALNDLYQVTDGVLRHLVVRQVKNTAPRTVSPPPAEPAAHPVESTTPGS